MSSESQAASCSTAAGRRGSGSICAIPSRSKTAVGISQKQRTDPLVRPKGPLSPLENTHELRSRLVFRLVAHVANYAAPCLASRSSSGHRDATEARNASGSRSPPDTAASCAVTPPPGRRVATVPIDPSDLKSGNGASYGHRVLCTAGQLRHARLATREHLPTDAARDPQPVRALHRTLGNAATAGQRAATTDLSRAQATYLVQAALPKPRRIVRK